MKKNVGKVLVCVLSLVVLIQSMIVFNVSAATVNVDTAAAFRNAVQSNSTITLTANIDLGSTPVPISKTVTIFGNGKTIYGRLVANTGAFLTLNNVSMIAAADILKLDGNSIVLIYGGLFSQTAVTNNVIYAPSSHTGQLYATNNFTFRKTNNSATSAAVNISGSGSYSFIQGSIQCCGQNRAIETYNERSKLYLGSNNESNKCTVSTTGTASNLIRIGSLGSIIKIRPGTEIIGSTTGSLIEFSQSVQFAMLGGTLKETGNKSALVFRKDSIVSILGGTLQAYGNDSIYATGGGEINVGDTAHIINITGGSCINASSASSVNVSVTGGQMDIGSGNSAIKIQGKTEKVQISGGTINSTSNASGSLIFVATGAIADVTISGGEFNANGSCDDIKHLGKGNIKITDTNIRNYGTGVVLNVENLGRENYTKNITVSQCTLKAQGYVAKCQCSGTGSQIILTTDTTNTSLISTDGSAPIYKTSQVSTSSIDYSGYRNALEIKDIYKNNVLGITGDTDTSDVTGRIFYVSSSLGSDSNNGLTKNSPFKEFQKALSVATFGDAILLKRGDVWRVKANSHDGYQLKSGILYGAYGDNTTSKPLILGSVDNYSGAGNWTNDGNNVWKTTIKGGGHADNMCGNVYFFYNSTDTTPALIGRSVVLPNENAFAGTRFTSKNDLLQEGDFYSVEGSNTLYVKCETNPGSKYGRIEVAEKRDVIELADSVVLNNIAVKFGGGHGINGSFKSNIVIVSCEVGYIGGATLYNDLYGNGIQFGQAASNIIVHNCYVYQCYDSGLTFQRWDDNGGSFNNITFSNNLLANNFYNIEAWTKSSGLMSNISICNNVLSEAGYCWSWNQRTTTGNNKIFAANIYCGKDVYYTNSQNSINISLNIFDTTRANHICWYWTNSQSTNHSYQHLTANYNTFYQKRGAVENHVMWYGNYRNSAYATTCQSGINTSSLEFDSNPIQALWIEAY